MSLKLSLERSEDPLDRVALVWTTCLPFIENSRGVLIHRPRRVTTYKVHDYPHLAINYYCGNGTTGTKNMTFLSDVPEGKLLCGYCEARAVMAGLPSTDELCGRHVHLGKVIGVQTCCRPASGNPEPHAAARGAE